MPRKEIARRLRIDETLCQALETRKSELHRDHEDLSPFVEWICKLFLAGEMPTAGQRPAHNVTVERIGKREQQRKTA